MLRVDTVWGNSLIHGCSPSIKATCFSGQRRMFNDNNASPESNINLFSLGRRLFSEKRLSGPTAHYLLSRTTQKGRAQRNELMETEGGVTTAEPQTSQRSCYSRVYGLWILVFHWSDDQKNAPWWCLSVSTTFCGKTKSVNAKFKVPLQPKLFVLLLQPNVWGWLWGMMFLQNGTQWGCFHIQCFKCQFSLCSVHTRF